MSGTRNWQVAVTALVFVWICTPLAAQDLGGFQMPEDGDDGGGGAPQPPSPSMPTTVEEWNQQIEQVESGRPAGPKGMLVSMTVEAYKAAYPDLPADVKQTIQAGEELTNAQVNRVADAMGEAMAKKMAEQMGGSAQDVQVHAEQIKPGSEDERSIKAFVSAMAPRMQGAGAAETTDGGAADLTRDLPGEQDYGFPESTSEDVRKKATESFKDFIHYGRLARLDLAAAHGRSFMQASVDPQTILEIIEDSPYSDSYDEDLVRMKNMDSDRAQEVGIAEVAGKVEQKIDQARIAVVRNPNRIREEINKLDDGLRPRLNATRRLKVAGEYAAPYLLEVITGYSKKDKKLHPYVIETMVEIGRPLVVPLAEAMKTLSPVAQQDIARVLGRIGYPVALPYLKALAEAEQTDEQTTAVLMEAFNSIAESRAVSSELGSGVLFLMLAEDYYGGRESLILEPEAEYNVMWYVGDGGRLTYRRIPTAIFGDVMAMRSARRALAHERSLSSAMSLWVAANFRRENNLPSDMTDPSYGPNMRSPHFYAVLSGPAHIKPALMRALNGGDAELALDLIGALEATAGAGSLMDHADAVVAALSYTDRRVRYEIAQAVGKADPDQAFDGSGRVIPVLAEAVRQGDERIAVVLAEDQSRLNGLSASVRNAGNFEVLPARTMAETVDSIVSVSSVDVVVAHADAALASELIAARSSNYKLQGAPMVVVPQPGALTKLNRMFADARDVRIVKDAGEQQLDAGVSQAVSAMEQPELSDQQARSYAIDALDVLRRLSISESAVLDVMLAEPALITALDDPRQAVAAGAAGVLATLDSDKAQRAVADAALDSARSVSLRVTLLDELAHSARSFGSRLSEAQTRRLLALVRESSGDLADAAARAHGALDLPTSHGVDLILQ